MNQGATGGQTMAQKIIAQHANRERVEVGEFVDCTPDYLVNQELMWPVHKQNLDKLGIRNFAMADRYIMVVDHTPSAAMGSSHPATHRLGRDMAASYGIKNFFGPGNGLRHLLALEKGFARPGGLVFSDEGNIASIGAVGAMSIPMTTDVVAVLAKGQNWVPVPRTVRIELQGRMAPGTSARDVAQCLIREFTASGVFMDCCLEFGGPGLQSLNLDQRQTILACMYHTGADTALMEVDAIALDYVKARAQEPFEPVFSDPDACYAMEIRCDLSLVEPMVTVPPKIDSSVPLRTVQGLRVDQASIGSCAGNRLEDLRDGARVLKGRRVARHVTFYVSPGSAEVFAQAAREGLLEIFAESGAVILPPGCNTCWGYQGVLTGSEVSITTHQFNYQGRNGSREAQIYIASAATVAASAVAGVIADPRGSPDVGVELDIPSPQMRTVFTTIARASHGEGPSAFYRAESLPGPLAISGRVWKFGDDVCGDDGIIDFSAVRNGFGQGFDEPLLRQMCFRRLNPEFPEQVRRGDIVVGGRNFAHQNHVEVSAAIKLSGIAAVLVESCESALVRRALSQGLPVMVVPGITSAIEHGETVQVDPEKGVVVTPRGQRLRGKAFSPRMLEIWQAGGLIASLQIKEEANPVAANAASL
jgi:3-isopropylmalate/(R)-2-methylmalate dehydratase large subunit